MSPAFTPPATCGSNVSMQDTPKRNDDAYVRAGGPYADLIRELVESGRYESASEVVLHALSLLRDQELLRKDRLKAEIDKGVESADRGDLIPADEVFARLRSEIRERTAKSGA